MHSQDALQKIKNAVALIEAPCATPPKQGTAYLISKSLACTCCHTLNGMLPGGWVTLSFRHGSYQAELIGTDAANDCALLQLPNELEVEPFELGEATERLVNWECYGHPAIASPSGVPLRGQIEDVEGEDQDDSQAIVLNAPMAKGEPLAGYSGSPVLINGRVIGHLKSNIERLSGENAFGLLYACHSRYIRNLLPKKSGQQQQTPPGINFRRDLYLTRRGPDRKSIESKIISDINDGKRVTVICGPARFGKTWTLARLRELLNEQHVKYHVAMLPVKEWLRNTDIDGSFFFRQFALRLCQEVRLPEEVVSRTWSTRSELAPEDRVERILMLDVVRMFSKSKPLILLLDQVDAVLHTPMGNTAINKLRAWVERHELPLRFLGSLSTTPAFLQMMLTSSPFNVDDGVDLPELDDEQIKSLCEDYGIVWTSAQLVTLRDWIGGHPYLVRLALHKAAEDNISPSELFDCTNPAFHVFRNFIIYLTSKLGTKSELLTLWRDLSRGRFVRDSSRTSEFIPLWRAGLIRYDAATELYVPRYKLYTLIDSPLLMM